jgi:hypothetical protein
LAAYGDTPIDRDALTYFRCERILEDISALWRAYAAAFVRWRHSARTTPELTFCHYLGRNFQPGGTASTAQREYMANRNLLNLFRWPSR